jgi:hypothetical protein
MNWDATSQIEVGGNHPQPGQFHSQVDRDTNADTGGHALRYALEYNSQKFIYNSC